MSAVTHTVLNPYLAALSLLQRLYVSEGAQGRAPLLGQGRPHDSQERAAKLWGCVGAVHVSAARALTLKTACVCGDAAAAVRCASRYTLYAASEPINNTKRCKIDAVSTHIAAVAKVDVFVPAQSCCPVIGKQPIQT